jgi:2-polyprenyl-6-methoxyphenol hydroxylase-like FAD-dependent oxidoreductase
VFSSGVTFALRGAMLAADTVSAVLRAGAQHAARPLAAYEREQQRLYRFVRRFVLGFYQPGFRDLLFAPTARLGLVRAVTMVLAGAWAPPLGDRLRLALVFGLARVQRRLAIVPRRHLATAEACISP